jgi:beta-lactamase regulating signal transducer with metallopeptidase domain
MVSVAIVAAIWEVGMIEWILTYAVHSTVLIGGIWVLTALVPKIPLGVQESLWKVALLGGLFTASVQSAAGVASPWGQLDLPGALAQPASAPQVAVASVEPPAIEREVVVHRNGDLQIRATRQRSAVAPVAIAAPAPSPSAPGPWRWLLLGLVAAGSLFASVRLVVAARRLRAQLKGRRDVIEDPVLDAFLSLCHKAAFKKRPRLTASPHLRSPIALPSHEICLPERAVDSLTASQQEGMLAHELAHLLRRDPLWQVAASVVEAVFFFQPLNHLARRKIQEVAEFQCDDWAAHNTGTGVHLAKCLAEVASWVEAGPASNPLATLMAHESSPIVRRITRLLNDAKNKEGASHPATRMSVTLGTLGLATWLIPGVGQASVEPSDVASDASGAPAADAALALAFEDLAADEHARSRVVLRSGDDIVELEVDHPRAIAAPTPAPAPVPVPEAPRSGGISIIIEGGGWGDPWFGAFGGEFHGFIGVDIDGLDRELESLFAPGFPFGGVEDFEALSEGQTGGWDPSPRWHHDRGGAFGGERGVRSRLDEAPEPRADERYQLLGGAAASSTPSGIIEL